MYCFTILKVNTFPTINEYYVIQTSTTMRVNKLNTSPCSIISIHFVNRGSLLIITVFVLCYVNVRCISRKGPAL